MGYDDPVTTDLARFGQRELSMARDLLVAYCDPARNRAELLGDGVRIALNMHSGYVFLTDEDCNVANVEGDMLEDFLVCGYCGHEAIRSDWEDEGHRFGADGEMYCRDEDDGPFGGWDQVDDVDEDNDEIGGE
jgi:hypothetical protein